MKQTLFILAAVAAFGNLALRAQNPKWFKKAAKAQISIITLDEQGNLLRSGNGFFIDDKGAALADYQLFRQASAAKVVTQEGKEYEVDVILGASSLYDVVKFRVGTDKPTPFLPVSGRLGVKHEHVYVMPYPTKEKPLCLNDTLREVQKFDGQYGYYALGRPLDDKYLNTPVVDEEGEVLGMIQRKAAGSAATSYAVSAAYGRSLAIHAMSGSDGDLNAIGIRKALPATEDEARTFLFMSAARADSASYLCYLDDYAKLFPQSSDAFTQRADFYMAHANYAAAEADMEKALSVASKRDEVCYTFSKLLYELNLLPGYTLYKDWDMHKALALVREAQATNPLPLYTQHEGNILYALKDFGQAYEKYFSLKDTPMRSADIFLYAAQCLRMQGTDTLQVLALQDSAVACFKKPYPRDAAPALLSRASTNIELGRYREAVLDMNDYEHLMRDELGAQFYYEREQAEMQCRMFQQAMDDIDRAIRMEPNEPLFHAERAVVLYRIGEPAAGAEAARRSTELDPQYAEGYRLMGVCLVEAGRREEGLAALRKAAEMGDEAAAVTLENLGRGS